MRGIRSFAQQTFGKPATSALRLCHPRPAFFAPSRARRPNFAIIDWARKVLDGYHTALSRIRFPARPAEEETIEITFPEEPLGISAAHGYGYIEMRLGDSIGPDGVYEVVRKLGYGRDSSVWAVLDESKQQYFAVKVLTLHASQLCQKGQLHELEMFERVSAPSRHEGREHCLLLNASFFIDDRDSGSELKHLCLVTDLLAADVYRIRDVWPRKPPSFPIIRHIIRDISLALDYLHTECRVVHTDLKHDNFMVTTPLTHHSIGKLLSCDAQKEHPPQTVFGRDVEALVRQPLPVPPLDQIERLSFKLMDFGRAQWIDRQTMHLISPAGLRAPETVLQHPWNEKVDIWALGCLTFEFICGCHLFFDLENWTTLRPETNHLIQMIKWAEDTFSPEMLSACGKRAEYFNEDGSVRGVDVEINTTTLAKIIASKDLLLDENEIDAASAFIKRCLRFSPSERPGARDLLSDPWLRNMPRVVI